jgi:hypothetical protein
VHLHSVDVFAVSLIPSIFERLLNHTHGKMGDVPSPVEIRGGSVIQFFMSSTFPGRVSEMATT